MFWHIYGLAYHGMLSGFEVRASCRDIGRSAVRRDPYGGLKSFFILLARIRAYQFSLKKTGLEES